MSSTPAWVPQRAAADQLGVSERTLSRWRSAGLLQPGEHFRRKFPASNSPLLYQLDKCEQTMAATFARDVRTLERAES